MCKRHLLMSRSGCIVVVSFRRRPTDQQLFLRLTSCQESVIGHSIRYVLRVRIKVSRSWLAPISEYACIALDNTLGYVQLPSRVAMRKIRIDT
jgi:hypothetical protein